MATSRGGGTQVQRGAAPSLRISRRRGLFLRPPHVRDFVKEGYFLYPGTKYGGQNPLTIHKIYVALTPSDSRSDSGLPSLLLPLDTQRIIKSEVKIRVPVHPMSVF